MASSFFDVGRMTPDMCAPENRAWCTKQYLAFSKAATTYDELQWWLCVACLLVTGITLIYLGTRVRAARRITIAPGVTALSTAPPGAAEAVSKFGWGLVGLGSALLAIGVVIALLRLFYYR